jgi:hypothetical protein
VGAFDLAEVHVWLAEMMFFNLVGAHLPGLVCLPGGLALHRTIGPPVFNFAKTAWVEQLRARMADWADWGNANRLPLFTTEGWGPINYRDRPGSSDGKEWRWVKEVCAEGVAAAIDLGWRGICTSNFCQPHFPGMWNDRLWHERMTALIRG